MEKIEFLRVLEYELGNISEGVKAEIVKDFGEHFESAEKNGKTEEEICQILGDPREIAREFIYDYQADAPVDETEERIAPDVREGGLITRVQSDSINKIRLEVTNCDIFFEGQNKNGEIKIDFEDCDDNRFITEIVDGALIIREHAHKSVYGGLISRLIGQMSKSAEICIKMPSVFSCEIDAATSSGDIEANDLRNLSSLKMKTASGDVMIERIHSHGDIAASSGSGDVEAENTGSGGAINLTTGSGDVTIENVKAETIRVTTGSGDIESNSSSGRLYAKTGSGDIEVDNHRGTVEGKTGSGDIEIDTDELGTELDYSTGSGDIDITAKKITADLKFTTGSGNISLYVNELSANIRGKTATGDINAEIGRNSDVRFELKTVRGGSRRNEFDRFNDAQKPRGNYTVSFETVVGDINIEAV